MKKFLVILILFVLGFCAYWILEPSHTWVFYRSREEIEHGNLVAVRIAATTYHMRYPGEPYLILQKKYENFTTLVNFLEKEKFLSKNYFQNKKNKVVDLYGHPFVLKLLYKKDKLISYFFYSLGPNGHDETDLRQGKLRNGIRIFNRSDINWEKKKVTDTKTGKIYQCDDIRSFD